MTHEPLAEGRLLFSREGPLVWLTLSRPERLNALDGPAWLALEQAFARISDDRSVRAVAIQSSTERAFCVGLDLGAAPGAGDSGGLDATVDRYQATLQAIEDCEKPVVAVLDGYVLGGGLELALACDVRVAADTATLGLTETRVGLIPGAGGTQRLPRYVGLGRARALVLTGDKIPAAEAYAMGLVDRVVPRAELRAAADDVLRRLVRAAPLAQAEAKRLVTRAFDMSVREGLAAEKEAALRLGKTRDLVEGFTAFIEKREPKWQGI